MADEAAAVAEQEGGEEVVSFSTRAFVVYTAPTTKVEEILIEIWGGEVAVGRVPVTMELTHEDTRLRLRRKHGVGGWIISPEHEPPVPPVEMHTALNTALLAAASATT